MEQKTEKGSAVLLQNTLKTIVKLKILILKETRNATKLNANYAYFPDVSYNYYSEYHTDFQDRELKSENVTFNDGF